MTMLPPLWYLDAATVARHMPDVTRSLELAARVYDLIDQPAGTTAKAPVRPLATGVFAQAMPGRLDDPGGPDGRPVLGMKWIAGAPGNRARGLPAMSALIVLNDPATGVPVAIMDGGPVTAARTAALSGAAIRAVSGGRAPRTAAMLGAGVQGSAHMPVLRGCGVERVFVVDRHPERAAQVTAHARALGLDAVAGSDMRSAVLQADLVVSATALAADGAWIGPRDVRPDAIVVPVDYGAQVTGALVSAAREFLVDDMSAYRETRERGRLRDWPEPTGTVGEAARRAAGGDARRAPGITVALHQGPGLADVMFADAVLQAAMAAGEGVPLRR